MKKYLLLFSLILFCTGSLSAKKTIIKMATLAPEGTEWHGMLVDLGQQWEEATNGQVILRIYPNGVVGDERDMIRKMRIGQIHAAAITSEGLSELNPDVNIFITPLIFDNYDDVDYVRSQIGDELEAGIKKNGFKLMYWADVGWAYWFATKPIRTPEDLRSMKIFTWAGDFKAAALWEKGGYNSVPLSSIDVLAGLQTGLINAMGTNPLVALSMQWFSIANNMSDIKWGLLTAGLVIDNRTWNKISPEYQAIMMEIAENVGKEHQEFNRFKDQEAIDAMKQYGLKVHTLTDSEKAEWKKLLRIWYPDIRGNFIPEEIFDEVVQLMDERNKTK
ncbi:MAG: TRAP transporter substrate-binding protein DctP [Candidatus Marinimicrobia bacterium]|nr:TRAP transporter substrate-binding protein DctP [Candidatus Neomarinimicrobiota bacterium]